jgi:hypothetical protein
MRVPKTIFVSLIGVILMAAPAVAGLSPQEMEAAKNKFVEKCLASGGTLKQGTQAAEMICTQPDGSKQTCNFAGEWAFCAGTEAPAGYDKQAAIATQKNRCDANGGTFHKGPGSNFYRCEYPDGGASACSYGPTFVICSVKEGSGLTLSKPLLQKQQPGRR